ADRFNPSRRGNLFINHLPPAIGGGTGGIWRVQLTVGLVEFPALVRFCQPSPRARVRVRGGNYAHRGLCFLFAFNLLIFMMIFAV
ncbi:hypothetical protein, partial [Thiolapillus sp.]|uniref:hypothetical protein n=1 Tax=Thiolapillus sp. TaxID=2017437 RepID=UPI003AF7A0CF